VHTVRVTMVQVSSTYSTVIINQPSLKIGSVRKTCPFLHLNSLYCTTCNHQPSSEKKHVMGQLSSTVYVVAQFTQFTAMGREDSRKDISIKLINRNRESGKRGMWPPRLEVLGGCLRGGGAGGRK
jgi:hypothetical protein